MKIVCFKERLRLPTLALAVLAIAVSGRVNAQQGGYSSQDFYRQGDAFSERVSGFFSRMFKAGSQATTYQQPSGYRTPMPSNKAAPAARYTYPQASTAAGTRAAGNSGAWPGYAQPQAPNYRTPPPIKSTSVSANVATKKTPAASHSSTRKLPISKPKSWEVSAPASTAAPNESVVKAPTEKKSPYSITPSEPDPRPLPKQSFSDTSTSTQETSPAKSNAAQSFPVATPGKAPGRVISPYPPNKELDVKGLPSGSLALDPTTQKVFKVP